MIHRSHKNHFPKTVEHWLSTNQRKKKKKQNNYIPSPPPKKKEKIVNKIKNEKNFRVFFIYLKNVFFLLLFFVTAQINFVEKQKLSHCFTLFCCSFEKQNHWCKKQLKLHLEDKKKKKKQLLISFPNSDSEKKK